MPDPKFAVLNFASRQASKWQITIKVVTICPTAVASIELSTSQLPFSDNLPLKLSYSKYTFSDMKHCNENWVIIFFEPMPTDDSKLDLNEFDYSLELEFE